MPDITDAQADALGAVLSEGMDPAYLARVGDFSDEQIAAGELRAADAEAERLNRDLYRRAIAAALEVRARGANQSRDWTEVRLSGQPPHGFPFYDFTFCSDHENWTALPQIWETAQGWTDVKVVTRRVHIEATEWEPWSP